MINELKDTLSKGGSQETMENMEKDTVLDSENQLDNPQFEKKPEEEKKPEDEKKQEPEKEDKENKEEKKEKERNYELSEIAEYVALQSQFSELQTKYNDLETNFNAAIEELEGLKAFKLAADRKEKEAMINEFYMLSDEDKKDVVENIDKYSLRDIEAELSIICVRNKVNFNLDSNEDNQNPQVQYTLNLNDTKDTDDAPEWVKSVRQKNN